MTRNTLFSWLILLVGVLYFFVPLLATLEFSLRAGRPAVEFSLVAYERVLKDPGFIRSITLSAQIAVATIALALVIVTPTAYWVHLRLPHLRPWVEFVTLLPFVVPAVVLVFGLIRIYSRPPLALTFYDWSSNLLLICAYTVLAFPYIYRSVDTGLRAIDVRTLTEAAQSLGANWFTILARVIFPNLRTALLSGAFLTFAIVMGEFTIAVFLARPTFGPYLSLQIQNKAYEPAALSLMSFALTWASMGLIQWLTRNAPDQVQVTGPR